MKCPHCLSALSIKESSGSSCPVCGTALARGETPKSTVERTSGPMRSVSTPVNQAATQAPAGKTWTGFLAVFAFMVLGAIVTIALEQGETNWVWLGIGIGAGVGVAVAQAAGLWPKKQKS